MAEWLVIFLLAVCGVLGGLLLRARGVVRDLRDALAERRRFLVQSDALPLRALGLSGVIDEANELIETQTGIDRRQTDFTRQARATLGAIQEAVLMLDGGRAIAFANDSARELFEAGRALEGARLESVVRSSSLLEYLAEPLDENAPSRREVSLEKDGEQLWFEVTRTLLRESSLAAGDEATLLVMHDITRLKKLEMVRREFVANVSHELRTPLTIVKGFSETLVEDGAEMPLESRQRFLEKILNNAQRLHLLVEDLLTLSRLESKPDSLRFTRQSLAELVGEVTDTYRNRLDPETQTMRVACDPAVGEMDFDRFRLTQVFENLIENVFRYASNFRCLTIGVRRRPDEGDVECSVCDDGPGIPTKDAPHIFERFYRVDKGRSRERGGTGLGLSITKHIVQLHGGDVWAESAEGKGTCVYFTLPEAPPASAAEGGGASGGEAGFAAGS